LGEVRARLAAEDRSFGIAVDHESERTIIKGMNETHLEIIVERLKREFKVEGNIGAPRIAHRETISRSADADLLASRSGSSLCRAARVTHSRMA
jgi:elongation factor G